jgi:two-component system NtrC family sensor kinase
MSVLRRFLKDRRRNVILTAVAVVVALAVVALGYDRWRAASGPAPLNDAQRAWLAERDHLRIGGRLEEPPFAFRDEDGVYQGYEVDLAESLGPVLGVGIDLVPMSQEERLTALDNGAVDAVVGLVQDAQNSEKYSFTAPYLGSSLSLFVPADSFGVTRLEDLRDRQVGVVPGTAAAELLAETATASPVPVQTVEKGFELLSSGQVDAVLADEIVGLRAAQAMGLEESIKAVGLAAYPLNYSFAVPKSQEQLLNVLNYALQSAEAVGLKQQVDGAWFGTPLAARVASGSSSLITAGLVMLVVGLGLGNTAYLLRRLRRGGRQDATVLEESRDKYEKLVEGTEEAVFSISSDHSLLEANNRLEVLTGYKKDELLRMSLDDLVPPEQAPEISECLERALRDGFGALNDFSLVNRYGDPVPMQLTAHLVSESGRQIIQCIARDVRERRRMRHQVLRRSEDLSAISAIANMVSHLTDLEQVLEQVLAEVLRLTGMQSGVIYVKGDDDGEMVPVVKAGLTTELMGTIGWPGGPRKLVDEVGKARQVVVSSASGQPLSGGTVRPPAEGPVSQLGVPLTSKDRVHGAMVLFGRASRRFTDQDKALLTAIGNQIGVAVENAQLFHQLQRSVSDMATVRRFSDSVLQNMTNGLVVIDNSGKVRFINRAGGRILGLEETEAVGTSVESVLGPGADMVRDSLERALVYAGEEIAVRRSAGETIPLGISVSPLRDDGGKLNGVVVMLNDLRETKALEEERRRLDRLSFLGEISAVMAHEIRNPLAGIVAGVQHTITKLDEGDEKRGAMERVLKESERVNRIIEDILLISRPPRLNLAPCDVTEVIDELLSRWADKASSQGIEVRKSYASGLPLVRGDRMRLHQALSNLILNGIEAMPNGGELSISVSAPEAGAAAGSFTGRAGYVEIEIGDTGVGIREEELGKIFEPFYTTKAGGTGLGLAITGRIINEHGGDVKAESQEGAGTRFIVTLPLARRGD